MSVLLLKCRCCVVDIPTTACDVVCYVIHVMMGHDDTAAHCSSYLVLPVVRLALLPLHTVLHQRRHPDAASRARVAPLPAPAPALPVAWRGAATLHVGRTEQLLLPAARGDAGCC